MANASDNYQAELPTNFTPLDVIYILLTILSAVLGLCFNSLTIAIIVKGKNFGKNIKIQLTNMAVADTLCSLATLISGIAEGLSILRVPYILEFCGLLQFVNALLFHGSLMSNTAISLERFVAVYFPLKMREYRRVHVVTVVIAVWLLSFLDLAQWISDIKMFTDPQFNPERVCTAQTYLAPTDAMIASYVTCACFPVFIIVVSYTLICIKLKRRKVIGEEIRCRNSYVNIQVNIT